MQLRRHHTTHLGHSTGPKGSVLVTGVPTPHLLACALRSPTRDVPALREASDTVDASTGTHATYEHSWPGDVTCTSG